jgi:peptidyl-prolyl cis-trans isomerase A (cyclophilin A)
MRTLIFLLLTVTLIGCKQTETDFQSAWTNEHAPQKFQARFETTKGDFEIEIERNLSPHAADRLYQLIAHGYFDDGIFYRVVPGFVAQFGNTDATSRQHWQSVKVPDEKVRHGNTKGTISFARDGKDTRDLEVFINLANNAVLDTLDFNGVKGFPALGNVIKGMDVVEALYSGYSEEPMDDPDLYRDRQKFYQRFPKLDLIKKAYLIQK